MSEQLGSAKLFGCFLLGNLAFAFFVARSIHPVIGFGHIAYAFDTWLTGFGPGQLYPFCYWSSALCFALWFLKQRERDKELLLKFVVASAVFSALYALVQMTGHDFIFHYAPGIDGNRPISFFGQYTRFGSFIGPVGAMALGMGLFIPWALLGAMTIATKSCFSIACFLIGSAVAGSHIFPRLKPYALLSTICGAAVSFLGVLYRQDLHVFFSHGRTDIWKATIMAWLNAPLKVFLFGFGPSSFRYLFAANFQPANTHDHGIFLEAHNDYLNLIFEGGVLGLVFLIAFLLITLWALKDRWWNLSSASRVEKGMQSFLVAILVNAFGNFPFQQAPHYFLGILSACVVLWCSVPPPAPTSISQGW